MNSVALHRPANSDRNTGKDGTILLQTMGHEAGGGTSENHCSHKPQPRDLKGLPWPERDAVRSSTLSVDTSDNRVGTDPSTYLVPCLPARRSAVPGSFPMGVCPTCSADSSHPAPDQATRDKGITPFRGAHTCGLLFPQPYQDCCHLLASFLRTTSSHQPTQLYPQGATSAEAMFSPCYHHKAQPSSNP